MKAFDTQMLESQNSLLHVPRNQYFATLMNPSEVAQATREYPSELQRRVAGKWTVCGDVSPTMFSLMQAEKSEVLQLRLTAFKSGDGFGYAVLTHQIRGHQHRLIMCLYDPPVREFLSAAPSQGVAFLLGNDDQGNCIILDSPIRPSEFLPLLAVAPAASSEAQHRALGELPDMLTVLAHRLQIPTLHPEYVVTNVSTSLLLPAIFKSCAMMAFMSPAK